MAYQFWSNVGVSMQSAIAATKTITAITLANPGVATSTAHGYANGDLVLLSVPGNSRLDSRVVRVAGSTADTFQLEGIDTTGMIGPTAGTAAKLTFGSNVTSATGVNASGGEQEYADVTTIHSNVRQEVPTITGALNITFDLLWDPSDAGQIALKAASDARAPRAFRILFSDGGSVLFYGYVSAPLIPQGEAQSVVSTQVAIKAISLPTSYAS